MATVDNNGLVTYHEDRSDSEDDSLTTDDKIAALEITGSTLYSNAPKHIFTVGGIYSDIQQVPNISEDLAVGDSHAEVYNLNGIYVSDSTENLEKGIYIVRNGNCTKKVVIK